MTTALHGQAFEMVKPQAIYSQMWPRDFSHKDLYKFEWLSC